MSDVLNAAALFVALWVAMMLMGTAWSPKKDEPRPYQWEVYWEDPCVEALRAVMEKMDQYLPTAFVHNTDQHQWKVLEVMTDEEYEEFMAVKVEWMEAKLQCWRH